MGRLAYRPIGIVISVFLVVSRSLVPRLWKRGLISLFLQTILLYNSRPYFRTSPPPPNASLAVHEASGPGAPKEFVEEGAASAVLLMLARNVEMEGAVASVKNLEERFNQKYRYPWVLLNEEPFTEEFKQ